MSREIAKLKDIQKEIEEESQSDDVRLQRLIIMVGAADFFGKGTREKPYELLALCNFLQNIDAVKYKNNDPIDRITHVLAFDKAYTNENIQNDVFQVNRYIHSKRHISKNLTQDKEENPEFYFTSPHKLGDRVEFHYIYENLETSYDKYKDPKVLNNLRETSVKAMAQECVPKANTLFETLANLLNEVHFDEYYLYNCAWIGGWKGYVDPYGVVKGSTEKQNRHFENMCELLHIVQNLEKPVYILSQPEMSVFEHSKKETLGKEYPLIRIPLNATTTFSKKRGGKRKTRKQKKTRKNRNDQG